MIKNLVTLNLSTVQKREWEIFQGYGFFLFVIFSSVVLCSYWYHPYRAGKEGKRNYERYASLALSDGIDDSVLENRRST